MYNKTILDTLFDAKNDFFALCAYRLWELIATVAFMAMIPWGRKFWLDAMHFLIILNGFVNIGFPEKICSPFIVEVKFVLISMFIRQSTKQCILEVNQGGVCVGGGMIPALSLVCPAFDHLITIFAHARYGYSLYFFI